LGAVFYLAYLRSELLRRKSRTILTLLGLSIGVRIVRPLRRKSSLRRYER